ncbi:MAG TPA: glycosyltransferase family 2 protein [Acidimicrobiales bacterium]|nr:glycosyltransferase family 2 protein [Acidimicrobiales bacterium]
MTLHVLVGVPCHRDEPGVARTVESLTASAGVVPDATVRIVVCLNGDQPGDGPAATALGRSSARVTTRTIDVASKPSAWNLLRDDAADIHVFSDADITVNPSALASLIAALETTDAVAATGAQAHEGKGLVARVARVPHRLQWGGLLGTLYAVRSDALPPEMPADLILDDAWLFGQLGADRVLQVPEAVATVQLPTRWRDLWRQRVRAERGKQQLKALGIPLAAPPRGASAKSAWRAYPPTEWPFVLILAAVKATAALRAKFGQPKWDLAESTKH